MSVVHLWLPGDGQTAVWCGHDKMSDEVAVTAHLVNGVTCTDCLRSASDFGGACRARLRELAADAQLSDGDLTIAVPVMRTARVTRIGRITFLHRGGIQVEREIATAPEPLRPGDVLALRTGLAVGWWRAGLGVVDRDGAISLGGVLGAATGDVLYRVEPKAAEPAWTVSLLAWTVSLLDHLDYIAKSSVTCHAPEANARRIAQLSTVVAELVKHIAAREQP